MFQLTRLRFIPRVSPLTRFSHVSRQHSLFRVTSSVVCHHQQQYSRYKGRSKRAAFIEEREEVEEEEYEFDDVEDEDIEIEFDDEHVEEVAEVKKKRIKKLSKSEVRRFEQMIDRMGYDEKYSEKPRYAGYGITPVVFKLSWEIFSKHFLNELIYDEAIQSAFDLRRDQGDADDILFKLYVQDCMQRFPGHFMNEKMSEHAETDLLTPTDLSKPHEWYTSARMIKRKIYVHTGPTNSGKTHSAFQRLKEASSGIYCAPLRLLATEGYVKLTENGVKCNLMTGDYVIENENATHISSTVEMVNVNQPVEVAVIDEIQLIGDEDRGWAWTRVLLGMNAKEIHVCGEERAISIVQHLCEETGDEMEIQHYKRLTPLKITSKSTIAESYKNIQEGDCVVAFSRKDVFKVKHEIERLTNLRVAVVYGSLPPKVRLEQSKLFNSENSKYDVLVATDAIGMGLNLNIRRIIFHSMEKFDGTNNRLLLPHEIRQIAGRAGRFGSLYPKGEATCLRSSDCTHLQNAFLMKRLPDIEAAGLFPPLDQIEYFTKHFSPDQPLSTTLESFYKLTETDPKYFMCSIEDRKEIAHLLHDIKELAFNERMQILNAPIETSSTEAMRIAKMYARHHSKGELVPLHVEVPQYTPNTVEQLREVESLYKVLDVYCWLSYRFSETFALRDQARKIQEALLKLITVAIRRPTNGSFVDVSRGRHESKAGDRSRSKSIHSNVAQRKQQRKASFKQSQEALIRDLQEYGIFEQQYSSGGGHPKKRQRGKNRR